MSQPLRQPVGIAPAAQLADDEPRLVADERGVEVLVRIPHADGRRAVDATLVGEGAGADVRRVGVRGDVRDLGHEARQLAQAVQVGP